MTERPQDSVIMDGNYFKGSHEIKFGFALEEGPVHSTSTCGPGLLQRRQRRRATWSAAPAIPYMGVKVNAPWASDVVAQYMNFYIGDTIT